MGPLRRVLCIHVHIYVHEICFVHLGVPNTSSHPCPILATSCSSFSPTTWRTWPCAWPHRHEWRGQVEKDHSSKAVRWKIWKTGAPGHGSSPSPPPSKCSKLPQFDWQTDFWRGLCPFQSEFIEGDFDLLHEATAVAMPSVTLIAWPTLWGECYGSWSFTDCTAFASIRTTCTEPDGEHTRLLWVFISVQEGVEPLGLPQELHSALHPCCSSTNTVFFSCHGPNKRKKYIQAIIHFERFVRR